MRVYHLLPTEWGLESIRLRRLRISRFSDLNDPFELFGANLRDKTSRAGFRMWKHEVSNTFGLMCFSESWRSPLLWSHYAEKHRGLCLGFDVPDAKVVTVRYLKGRFEINLDALNELTITRFLTSKFAEWSYEKERRLFTNLTEMDAVDGNYYIEMSEELFLREVIVGALNDLTRERRVAKIEGAGLSPKKIQLTKARLAFKSYAVVRDKRGLL